jgi:hypothetical protein
MTGKDKDYRYMATSDLLNELNKEGFKADTDLEIKLSNIVLQQLDDVAGDVSGLAVKWYVSLSLSLSDCYKHYDICVFGVGQIHPKFSMNVSSKFGRDIRRDISLLYISTR